MSSSHSRPMTDDRLTEKHPGHPSWCAGPFPHGGPCQHRVGDDRLTVERVREFGGVLPRTVQRYKLADLILAQSDLLGRTFPRYLRHLPDCDRGGMIVEPPMKLCTCGLHELEAEHDKLEGTP